uniref:hypothetical protein n=1 Tax=Prevotella heparinolytica TaxID=28113 RepID=UPI0035A0CEEC
MRPPILYGSLMLLFLPAAFVRLSAASLSVFLGVARYIFDKIDKLSARNPNKISMVFHSQYG